MAPENQTGDFTLAAAIRRYFDVVLFLLIFTGFGTLASTGQLDPPTVLLVTAGLLYRGYILARRRQVLLSDRWTNLLTIACVGFFIADEFFISRAFLAATVHLVLFVMLVRLFSAQRDRDHYLLAVLSFGMVLAAAVLTVDSTFLFALAGFVLIGIAAFILMEMMHSAQKAPVLARDPHVRRAYRKLSFTIASIAPVLLVLIFAGAALIFFVLPRVSAGYMSAYNDANDLTTGFSDRVELGRIGQIQQSKSVVMHVQVDGDRDGLFALKLRGVTLSSFDGRSWANSHDKVNIPRGYDGRFNLLWPVTHTPPPSSMGIHYHVTMEPFVSDVFFLMAESQSLAGNYRSLARDTAGNVFDVDPDHPVTRYDVDSLLRTAHGENSQKAAADYPAQISSTYLQYSPTLDPRIKLLAEKISTGASSPRANAAAIENYLRTHFEYTLELPATTPRDPLANFLFERRKGHCEYFASSMAVMLRAVGIPSRVVNGFSGGEFNDITSQYVIRASDAHSWVDAYIPGDGWVEFDPTPPGGGQAHQWSRMMLYLDAMSSFWREWVVNYDLAHQLRLSQDAGRGSRAMVSQAQSWGRDQYQKLLRWASASEDRIGRSTVKWGIRTLVLFLLVLIAACVPRLLAAFRRLRWARKPQAAPQTAATIWYERMLRQTARRGWRKSPAQTPEEFAAAITDPELQKSVFGFSQTYERARFGRSVEDACRLPDLYQEIKSSR
jgi:protein-glutamine gamma-glutamyltransferase